MSMNTSMKTFMEKHKAEMHAVRHTKLFTDFASYSKRRDVERRQRGDDDGDGGGGGRVASGADSETNARAYVVLGGVGAGGGGGHVGGWAGVAQRHRDAPGDPPVAMMLAALHHRAKKTGRERKGVWSEFGKPYECGHFVGRDASGEEVTRDGAMVEVERNVRDTFPKRAVHPDEDAASRRAAEKQRRSRREEDDAAATAAAAASKRDDHRDDDDETSLADFLKDAGWGGSGGGDRGGDSVGVDQNHRPFGGGENNQSLVRDPSELNRRPASGSGTALTSRERQEALFPRDQLRVTRQRALAARTGASGFTSMNLDMVRNLHIKLHDY